MRVFCGGEEVPWEFALEMLFVPSNHPGKGRRLLESGSKDIGIATEFISFLVSRVFCHEPKTWPSASF